MHIVVLLLFLGLCGASSPDLSPATSAQFSPGKSYIWGPGLNTEFVMPVRYIYLQTVDHDGRNLTVSVGKDFQLTIESGRGRVRVWRQILDRHDGSYIIRWRLYNSFTDLKITLLHNDEHVAKSPYLLNGTIYNEHCHCPHPDTDTWLEIMQCPSHFDQIEKDFLSFPKIDLEYLNSNIASHQRSHSLAHYTIKNNQIYRKTYGKHVDFKMFSDAMLMSLARKVKLPDVEFVINLGDWPLEKRSVEDGPLPVISWCGSNDTRDIVVPTYDLTEATLEALARHTLDIMTVQANTGPKWNDKTEKAFWRGRDSRRERLNLVKLSRQHPELLDAALTNFFFFRDQEEIYGPKVSYVSFFDFFEFKYQLNIDGTVAAYRLPYLLAGDSAIIKHESKYYEHFYHDLKPWVHYIPYELTLTDLISKIEWAQEHDQLARQIAAEGQLFARKNLMPHYVYCYYYMVLQEYASRQVTEPTIRDDMERVELSVERVQGDAGCTCERPYPTPSHLHSEL